MITQEILNTFVHETMDGKFAVSDPTEFDQTIGYYDNKIEAENAFKEYVTREQIIFE